MTEQTTNKQTSSANSPTSWQELAQAQSLKLQEMEQELQTKNSKIIELKQLLTELKDRQTLKNSLDEAQKNYNELLNNYNKLKNENKQWQDKENSLNIKAQELAVKSAQIQKEIEEKGKSIVETKLKQIKGDYDQKTAELNKQQEEWREKNREINGELARQKEITKRRQEEILPGVIKRIVAYAVLVFGICGIVFGYWAYWGYKAGVADEYSEEVIGKKQITITHFIGKDETRIVDDTQTYIKPLIQGLYELSKGEELTAVDSRVLKALSVHWADLEYHKPQKKTEQKK